MSAMSELLPTIGIFMVYQISYYDDAFYESRLNHVKMHFPSFAHISYGGQMTGSLSYEINSSIFFTIPRRFTSIVN